MQGVQVSQVYVVLRSDYHFSVLTGASQAVASLALRFDLSASLAASISFC